MEHPTCEDAILGNFWMLPRFLTKVIKSTSIKKRLVMNSLGDDFSCNVKYVVVKYLIPQSGR